MSLQVDSVVKEIENYEGNFHKDVIEGLNTYPKKLYSKYFYDPIGDRLFQDIMQMPEYYLTDCELEIFSKRTLEMAELISADYSAFDLIELGAGDALKSSHLLRHLSKSDIDYSYMPIDISGNILTVLCEKLSEEIPNLDTVPLEGEYFEMLNEAMKISERRKVVLFLGGNIGNMDVEEAQLFCAEIRRRLSPGDLFIIGFDLKKNPHTILSAYNDKSGITSAFNINLLHRINRELGANFDTRYFQHYQTYDPISGACRSFLVSLTNQYVHIKRDSIFFKENELIDMEISQKYSLEEIQRLSSLAGFELLVNLNDNKGWFVDSIWRVA
ncbi:L-histidine N(alpha)-methyltransferase [Sphingobacterium zeae]|uniref:L-histidine N-alpha-methyltransferase n=1 Tax=Sphingobacterium zeae TaxID=1776859 RepID=A0ABU0U8I8_9SPHI|nr:L-histidine N(alpha)-methyltransferase [Sphingobacterium zeae]MDQ1151279.1 L-histidine N-alpha-methyltransferase [Sphingobacterium zeae]